MNKLKFHLINYKDILSSLNIVGGNLDEYLYGGRQDVLENFDIFCENVRSKNKKLKNFDLFERVNVVTDDCVIVLGLYLELLEFWGQRHRIYDVVKFYTEKYPNNKKVIDYKNDSINPEELLNQLKDQVNESPDINIPKNIENSYFPIYQVKLPNGTILRNQTEEDLEELRRIYNLVLEGIEDITTK